MANIKFTQFGGITPSVDARNLPPEGAQIAQNLDLRFGDFRPMKGLGSSVATVSVAGAKSIFRTPSGVWLDSINEVYYVNGQIPDAASERVYLTGRSGYPEAWQGGSYRRLGVPAPSLAPSCSVTVNSEFTSADAVTATEKATAAIVTATKGTASDVVLGNAVAALTANAGTYDPLYDKVRLHLDFASLVGGQFQDKSPQKVVTTKETGVTLGSDNTGPLGAGGSGYGNFAGGVGVGGITFPEIRRWQSEADPTWTIDVWLTPAETLPEILIESWSGANRDSAHPNLRKIAFLTAGGAHRTLACSAYSSFATALRSKRADGSDIMTAGVPMHLAVQNTGSAVEVYADGVLVGRTPWPCGLEFSTFCRANNVTDEAWLGKVDELRVTFAARYSGNFSVPTGPYPTAKIPAGVLLAHGATTGLPTTSAIDAAYLIQLAASGGGWASVDSNVDYLRSFTGAQLTYSGNQNWAVLFQGWRANGKSTSQASIRTAIGNVDDPMAAPGTKLLTSAQADALAPLLWALYDPAGDLGQLVSNLNAAQFALLSQVAVNPAVPAETQNKLTALKAASDAIAAYFSGIDAKIRTVLTTNLSTLFGSYNSLVVTRDMQTRAYIVTYVTDWGEESAPSPASDLLSVDQNDVVNVTATAPPSGRNVVGWRLYRSASTGTSASWALVEDATASNAVMVAGSFNYFAINNLGYADSQPDEKLQEPCPSLTWAEPPSNLQGLVGLPNGIMVGFFGRTLCFSEPYRPHAWPVEYQIPIEYDIVGIGVFGNTAVTLTKGFPYYASGADSASMSAQKIEVPQSCIAARSIATVDGGVIYASPDGLCLASPSGIDVLTQGAFNKDDWQATVTSAARGAFHDGAYYLATG